MKLSSILSPGRVAGLAGAAGAVAMAFGRQDVANVLGNITPDAVDGAWKLAMAGSGLVSIIAGFLPSKRAA
jgi:hypothetical protein